MHTARLRPVAVRVHKYGDRHCAVPAVCTSSMTIDAAPCHRVHKYMYDNRATIKYPASRGCRAARLSGESTSQETQSSRKDDQRRHHAITTGK